MADTMMVMQCAPVDFDATTGVCAHPVWAPAPSVIPPFSAEEGVAVGVAMLSAWAIAYGFKLLRRAGD